MVREGAQSMKSGKSNYNYDKVNEMDNVDTFAEDDMNMEDDDLLGMKGGEMKAKSGKRDHEIYDNTYYIPNDKLRLLEIPMNSNLFFQMLLYYHAYYDMLYGLLLIPSGIYKILIGGADAFIIVSPAVTIFYCITELFRLNFGYRGNINESFPELIAFII